MKMTIMGLGLSGIYALRFLDQKGHELYVVDKKDKSEWDKEIFQYVSSENSFEEKELKKLPDCDLVILSPGISRSHPLLKGFKPSQIISEGELVFKETDIPIIAITGTNGKTTTTTMMGMAFKKAGLNPFVGGNIGLPIVESQMSRENYGVLILELSSFQLESSPSLKPRVGVILNIMDNHGERYERFIDYKMAKLNLFNHFDSETTAIISPELDKEVSVPSKILLEKEEIKKVMGEFDFSNSKLVGEHNKENLFVVFKTLLAFKVEEARRIIQELIDEFKGVHYRLEFVAENANFLFYNDAKSTNNFATVTALKAVAELNLKVRLILGGKLRNDRVNLLEELLPFKNLISCIHVIGEAGELLEKELKEHFLIANDKNLETTFSNLKTDRKEVLLFSPAFPSFDQYANYLKRGEAFEVLVKNYLKSCE